MTLTIELLLKKSVIKSNFKGYNTHIKVGDDHSNGGHSQENTTREHKIGHFCKTKCTYLKQHE